MFRSLSPVRHEEFKWEDQNYLGVSLRNIGTFNSETGTWEISSKRQVSGQSQKADGEGQKLREEIEKQRLTQVMLEQMVVERTLALKATRKELVTFILRNRAIFEGSDLMQAALEAEEKEKKELTFERDTGPFDIVGDRHSSIKSPPESQILDEEDEDEMSLSRMEEHKTSIANQKPPKYYRSGSPSDSARRMISI